MLARKFANYRLNMAEITQNKKKCLNFVAVPPGEKNCGQIILKRRKS